MDRLAAQLRRTNEELASVAATDALTGLPNRRAFEQAPRRDLARATYDHATGDVDLRSFAEVLRSTLWRGTSPARLGGEEFVALLPNTSAEGGKIVAERLPAKLAATAMPGPSGSFNVTASIGVASVQGAACRGAETTFLEMADALHALVHR